MNNISYCYKNIDIAFFDNDGISNNNPEATKIEREIVIKTNIPVLMQPDFEYLRKYSSFRTLFSNQTTFFILRVIKKLYQKVFKGLE